MKRRLVYFSLSFLCFIACVFIVKLFKDNQFIRGFIGDIIVISLIYFFIKILYDFNALKLTVFTLVIAFITEFIQLLKLTALLGIENSTLARLILGSVFDPYDLIAYTIGAFLVYIIDTRLVRDQKNVIKIPMS
ncbi:MAG: ribosomal maturation YjgA family protein [Ruminiclostridium sp.]